VLEFTLDILNCLLPQDLFLLVFVSNKIIIDLVDRLLKSLVTRLKHVESESALLWESEDISVAEVFLRNSTINLQEHDPCLNIFRGCFSTSADDISQLDVRCLNSEHLLEYF
jgi:hypothetical protein